jgi:LPS-assembly protein
VNNVLLTLHRFALIVILCDFSILIYLLCIMRSRFLPFLFLSCFFSAHIYAADLPLSASAVIAPTSAVSQVILIEAEQIEASKSEQVTADGQVQLEQGSQKLSAEHIIYNQQTGDISARGAVRLEQPSGIVSGPDLRMNLDSSVGVMNQPIFEFHDNDARGTAQKVTRSGPLNYEFNHAIYTTCPAGNDDWLLNLSTLEIDRKSQIGTGYNAWVEFKGVPLLYTPWMDFPLDGRRRSGVLGPVFGVTAAGGSEITLPIYLNLAPNYDATIAPRVISKRGVLLNDEFRYLGSSFLGEINYDFLQNDQLTQLSRSRFALRHSQNLGGGFGATVKLEHVSDDAYFRDLATTVMSGTQTQLLNEGTLSYGGGWWSAMLKAQSFQTLQDPLAPVAIPYHRLPQINVSASKSFNRTELMFVSEYVNFYHPTLVNGERIVTYPSVAYALLNDTGYYLKPKLGLHSTQYVMNEHNSAALPTMVRNIPIFSLDSGLNFERDLQIGDHNYVQSLEPRIYYVNVPYQNQDALPNYDTSQAVFNFSQMFTENRFFGNDRVGDANMATVALTSRLIDDIGGTERLRLTLGERFSFSAPRVNLTAPDANSRSDVLLAAAGRVTDWLTVDSAIQYNPNAMNTQSSYFSTRYKKEKGKVLNLAYRYTRGDVAANDVRQVDFSTQWPLFWHWYAVSRMSYSLQDNRVLEALAGLEYNQVCWMLRLVAQRFPTATQQVSTGIFVQLELNDLVALGSDPLSALRMSIPGYEKLNTPTVNK